jgi:hemoglobin
MATDYERIGGGPAVSAVVDSLYARLTVDPLVGHYFEHISLPDQKRHMILMLTKVLGGPDTYDGRPLDVAHQPLGISDADYDRVGETLMGILGELSVPDDIQGRVVEVLGAVRPQVVSQS